MKAAVFTQYGGPEVLQLQSVAKPSPKDHEILIRIQATAVNSGDCRLRKADPFAVRFFFGLFKPGKPILGGVLSGTVEAVGSKVTTFRVGDSVFGATQLQFGAYAEYICLPETGALAIKPTHFSHDEAAALPFGGTTAYHFVQQARIQPGQNVLVYGASGAVGSTVVQMAKYFGARVTGVCSTANLALVKHLGADEVLDYTQTDFSKTGEQYDVVFETVNKAPVSACLAVLRKNGTLVLSAAMLPEMLRGAWAARSSGIRFVAGMATETPEAIRFVQQLAEGGQLKAVVDKKFSLDDIVAAHAYVDKGHKKGNVVMQVP
ncbi:MAG: NAD(P)-dependent alcohol dehydrogenase [Saprospiraceae bacterium]|nr:NAD(P)-dependent alcohol dehydrogenase [Saprospiraceae bacterium]